MKPASRTVLPAMTFRELTYAKRSTCITESLFCSCPENWLRVHSPNYNWKSCDGVFVRFFINIGRVAGRNQPMRDTEFRRDAHFKSVSLLRYISLSIYHPSPAPAPLILQ